MASYACDGLVGFNTLRTGELDAMYGPNLVEEGGLGTIMIILEDVSDDEEYDILAGWYEGDKHYTL